MKKCFDYARTAWRKCPQMNATLTDRRKQHRARGREIGNIYIYEKIEIPVGWHETFHLKTDRNRCTRFRPKTKPKTKVIIFVDYSVISRQHQQYSTISCSTFIAMSSLQRVQALNCSQKLETLRYHTSETRILYVTLDWFGTGLWQKLWSLLEYRPSEFRCFRSAFPPKTKTKTKFGRTLFPRHPGEFVERFPVQHGEATTGDNRAAIRR